MGKAEQKAKNSKMAADLLKRGIFHGKRQTSPAPNSGGTTMVMNAQGSSKNQRRNKRSR